MPLKNRGSIVHAAEHFLKSNNPKKALEICFTAAKFAEDEMDHSLSIRYYKMCLLLEKTPNIAKSTANYNSIETKLNLANLYILISKIKNAQIILTELLKCELTDDELMKVNYIIGVTHSNLAEMEKASEYFKTSLSVLGMKIPNNKGILILKLCWEFLLIFLPPAILFFLNKGASDKNSFYKVKILNKLAYSYFYANTLLCLYTHFKSHNLSRKIKLSPEQAETFSHHSVTAFLLYLKKRALRFAIKSISLSNQLGRKDLIASTKVFAGMAYFYNAQWKKSMEFFTSSTAIYKSIGDAWGQLFSLEQSWLLSLYKGDFKQVSNIMAETRHIQGDTPDKQFLQVRGFLQFYISTIFGEEINPKLIKQKIGEIEESERIMSNIQCYAHAAKIYILKDDFCDAFEILEKSVTIIKSKNMMQEYVTPVFSHVNQLLVFEKINRNKGVTSIEVSNKNLNKYWKKCLNQLIFRSVLYPAFRGDACKYIAWYQFFKGRHRVAKFLFKKAIKYHKILDMKYDEAQSHRDLALFYEETFKPGFARDEFEIAYNHFKKCGAKVEIDKLSLKVENTSESIVPVVQSKVNTTTLDSKSMSNHFGSFRLQSLSEISQSITEIQDLNLLLNQILKAMIDVTAAQKGSLYLNESEHLDAMNLTLDYKGNEITHGENNFSRDIVEWVSTNKKQLCLKDGETDDEDKIRLPSSNRSVLCIPLISKEVLLGVAYLSHDRIAGIFGMDSEKAATVIAGQASVLLDNAQHIQKFRDLNKTLEKKVEEQTHVTREKSKKLENARLKTH